MSLGERVRFLRKQAGLSQDELANKIEINRNFLSRIETGKSDPTASVLIKMAKLFNTSISSLVGPINDDTSNEAKIKYIEDLCRNFSEEDLNFIIRIINIVGESYGKRDYVTTK